ncbi:hypothetical protein GCM10023187_31980 [Nibrella viscosa]|uniref:Acetyltransferase (GNAT) domain-containing protein n=1 Tax=Nibrella viscosa TaxID=1084524 RepID=A0ABP8KL63_9BACT
MLQTQLLRTPADLQQFVTIYHLRSQGISVDPVFLERATVRVFLDQNQPGEWIAGYFVNANPPHRYFSVLPADCKLRLLQEKAIAEEDVAEIGAIWMDVKALGRLGRWMVYLFMLADAYATNRPYLIGGTVHMQLRDFQMQVMKHPLFEGDVEVAGQIHHIWEYYTNRDELWFDFLNFTVPEMRRYVTRETIPFNLAPFCRSA